MLACRGFGKKCGHEDLQLMCKAGATSVIGRRRAGGRYRHEDVFTLSIVFYSQMLLLSDNDCCLGDVSISLINFITTSEPC